MHAFVATKGTPHDRRLTSASATARGASCEDLQQVAAAALRNWPPA
ncbi:hypothetical protein [Micromonospora sp. NPDC005367]